MRDVCGFGRAVSLEVFRAINITLSAGLHKVGARRRHCLARRVNWFVEADIDRRLLLRLLLLLLLLLLNLIKKTSCYIDER